MTRSFGGPRGNHLAGIVKFVIGQLGIFTDRVKCYTCKLKALGGAESLLWGIFSSPNRLRTWQIAVV